MCWGLQLNAILGKHRVAVLLTINVREKTNEMLLEHEIEANLEVRRCCEAVGKAQCEASH